MSVGLPSPKPSAPDGINALRLPGPQLERLHKLLDGQADAAHGRDRRSAERCAYHRAAQIVVTLRPPGGVESQQFAQRFSVISRDVSEGGVGFLHGAYVHVSSQAVVELESLEGIWKPVPGSVVRCRHVSGKLHEVGVAFDEQIDLGEFVTMERATAHEAPSAMPRLSGQVICVTSSKEIRGCLRDLVSQIGVKPIVMRTAAEAMIMIEAAVPCDVLLLVMDDNADESAMRCAGWSGPKVWLTTDPSEAGIERFDAVMHWPADVQNLHDTLLPYLELADRTCS